MAELARAWGLPWDGSTVARKEAGERRLTATELLLIPIVLNCTLGELVEAEKLQLPGSSVEYASEPGALLRRVAAGERPFPKFDRLPTFPQPVPPVEDHVRELGRRRRHEVERIWPGADASAIAVAERSSHSEAERNAARLLGLDPFEVALLSIKLWGATFQAERNRRTEAELGDQAQQIDQAGLTARRGHVTRVLLGELRSALSEDKA